MLTSFVIAGECDNYSGSYIYTENIPSEESDGCDWKNLDSRDPIQNLKTLNNHYGYWGCDDSSTQVTYCLITSCDGVGQACGTNTGECVAGNYVCSTSGLYCNGAVEPTAESLDGLDNDCDGTVDNVVNLKNPKYFPNTWYTANSNFSMLDALTPIKVSSDLMFSLFLWFMACSKLTKMSLVRSFSSFAFSPFAKEVIMLS